MSSTMLVTHSSLARAANVQRPQHNGRPQRLACAAASRSSYLTGAPLPATCRLAAASVQRPRRQVTTCGLFGLGFPELAVIAGVVVVIFGPSKLPELGKELGKTVKSFQTAAKEFETELKTATDDAVDDAAKTLEEKKEELR